MGTMNIIQPDQH